MVEIEVNHCEDKISPEEAEAISKQMEEKYNFADRKAPEDVPAN